MLAKVNVDENPAISQAFQVQSIPAVFALRDGQVVDGFVGAYPEHEVQRFVDGLLPTRGGVARSPSCSPPATRLSLRQVLELEPGNEDAIVALAEMLVEQGDGDEALALLERIPETDRTRKVAAAARVGHRADRRLRRQARRRCSTGCKGDDDARQEFVDILELMGPDDPRHRRLPPAPHGPACSRRPRSLRGLRSSAWVGRRPTLTVRARWQHERSGQLS